ncbi:MAG: TetR/AcrR family transcriptional regulator [Actinomycetota bacterium]
MSDELSALRNQPRQRRSEETVRRIIEAAGRAFGERGFDAATMTDVALDAEVSTGSMYHFFPDKLALAKAVCEEYRATALAMLEAMAPRLDSVDDIGPLIDLAIEWVRASFERSPGFVALAMHPGQELSAYIRAEIQAPQIDVVRSLIDGLDPAIDAERRATVAAVVVSSLGPLVFAARRNGLDDEVHMREVKAMVTAYLQAVLR